MEERGRLRRADIKQRQLQPEKHASAFIGIAADRQQQVAVERLQMIGVARHMQLAEQRGRGRLSEVDHKQRIGEAKGDKVGPVIDDPRRVELFVGGDASEAAHHLQRRPLSREHHHPMAISPLLHHCPQETVLLANGKTIQQCALKTADGSQVDDQFAS